MLLIDNEELLFHIVQGEALLYEVAKAAPKLYGFAMERLSDRLGLEAQVNFDKPVHEMAREYLEWVYNGAPKPDWWAE